MSDKELPRAVDMFQAMWSREIFDEDNGLRPGTELWESNKKNAYAHWTRIWIECKMVCKHIQEYETISEECKNVVEKVKREELLWDPPKP